jgi:hypothetical protein
MLLKSKIEAEMPCLNAELILRTPRESTGSMSVGTDATLLDGQISSWMIRLSNTGSAPASKISLKTNLPWVHLVAFASSKSTMSVSRLEAQATSNCVGPTGTLIELPIHGEGLQEDGAIHPGESLDIPIEIRTTGTGKQSFYMLYRYELSDPNSSRHRWLRKMFQVPVRKIHRFVDRSLFIEEAFGQL